jgi:large subunit ribosomal protein L21
LLGPNLPKTPFLAYIGMPRFTTCSTERRLFSQGVEKIGIEINRAGLLSLNLTALLFPMLQNVYGAENRLFGEIQPFLQFRLVFFDHPPIFAVQFLKPYVMYAVVDIAGKQFKVEKDQYLYTPLLEAKAGDSVKFDKVLLIDADGTVQVGTPLIKGAVISGKVVEHVKDDKVIVFKKKRRKGYALKNGHRQKLTKVQIESIKA